MPKWVPFHDPLNWDFDKPAKVGLVTGIFAYMNGFNL